MLQPLYPRLFVAGATILMIAFIASGEKVPAHKDEWFDSFYQYRIPLTFTVQHQGWNRIPVTPEQITRAVNQLEEFQFDPAWFASNHLIAVEAGEAAGGQVEKSAGIYVVPAGPEMFNHPLTGEQGEVRLPTISGELYLATYTSKGAGESPFRDFRRISYEPPLLPKAETTHRVLIQSGEKALIVRLGYPGVTQVTKMSIRRVRLEFLGHFASAGTRQWMLYYQPMCANYLHVPAHTAEGAPQYTASVKRPLEAEKRLGQTRYPVASTEALDIWFADSTVKITPETPVPAASKQPVRITSAKGEAQSFQLVIKAKEPISINDVAVSDLQGDSAPISPDKFKIEQVEYVPIHKNTVLSPTQYTGFVADAIVKASPTALDDASDNYVLWFTVRVPRDIPAGPFPGRIEIKTNAPDPITIPIELVVHDFELPEFSPLRTNVGAQFLFKADDPRKSVMAYHGLSDKAQYKQLAKKYFDIMAENKFYPKSVALFSEIGMKWSPPPQGYNVDLPGNYFQLHDWDFTEFNRDMKHYIDDLKVNTVCLTHTNPTVANMFRHLPGNERQDVNLDPPHISMAWQFFRDHTYVEWDKQPSEGRSDVIEITRDQFDHLVLDFYRAIAKNLKEHGWTDRFIVLVDETSNIKRIEHLIKLLKSDPMTAKLQIVGCMQSFEYLQHKDADGKQPFNGLITYMPQMDEDFCRWAPHFWDDYSVSRQDDSLWFYAVGGSRLAIDVPGINNRIIGMDLFVRGARGFHISDTIWWNWPGEGVENPWVDPTGGRWANGAYSYFYPPRKEGPSPEPDYTLVPSVRVMTFREAVDDYEYAWILSGLIRQAEADGKTGESLDRAQAVLADMRRTFDSPVHWSQNDAWLLELRDRAAASIVELRRNANQAVSNAN